MQLTITTMVGATSPTFMSDTGQEPKKPGPRRQSAQCQVDDTIFSLLQRIKRNLGGEEGDYVTLYYY